MSKSEALRRIAKEKNIKTGRLHLKHLELKEIPEEIVELTHLTSLSLSSNQILDYTIIEELRNLTSLYLSSNQILDIYFLENLTKLTLLDLSGNRISNLCFLEKLTNLISLDLRYNKISDISFLEKLTNLNILNLNNNQISDIRYLEKLINLNSLNLNNNLISDIRYLGKLINLNSLNLNNNLISDIKPLIPLVQLDKIKITLDERYNGNYLQLGNNPIKNPPIETFVRGNEAIIKYFKDLESQGSDNLYEAKLLIVGEGESGKTTLAWKIKDINAKMPHKGNDRTKGIDIQSLEIDNKIKGEKPFKMNIWDFGGQEIYHATHQFFLTKRSLYVIVNNTRSNLTDFNHWVQTINLFSDNSPIIIVQNEVAGSPTDFDLRGIQGKFKNVLFVKNADLSNIKNGKIQKLIQSIQHEIQTLDHIGIELPAKWVAIRADLEKVAKKEPYIKATEFEQICIDNEITDKDAMERLGDLFHDLGVMLHFRDDKVLKHYVILQNTWATKGVYAILDDSKVKDKKGHFSYRIAKTIWKNSPFEGMHDELLQLMEKFELCYELNYKKGHYVSPQLLPIEQPEYTWNKDNNLLIYYDYEFMPKGLLARLIVRLHRYIKDVDTMAWRTGCVFTHQETDAQVIETYGSKKIEIRIKGKHCTDLTAIIVKEIDELNAEFKRLVVDKLIPCNCSHCKGSETLYFYKYQELKERLGNGKMTIDSCKHNNYKSINIRTLLNKTVGNTMMEVELKSYKKYQRFSRKGHNFGGNQIIYNTTNHYHQEKAKPNIFADKLNRQPIDKTELQEYLEDGEMSEVFDVLLEKAIDENLKNEIRLVKNNWREAKRKQRKKLMSNEDFEVKNTQTMDTLLDWISEW